MAINHRDEVRTARKLLNQKGTKLGIVMDSERQQPGANQRTLSFSTLKLINDQTPRTDREQLQLDDPPAGAFNGGNTAFTLSRPVTGLNIHVIWGDSATPQTLPLVKSNTNPPAAGEFFFDPNDPTHITVGTPPQPTDRLVAVYRVDQ